MFTNLKLWFGFGQDGHSHGHGDGSHSHDGKGHGHRHGVIDPNIASSERGIWAIKWSFVILAITAALQLVVVLYSGSVALLADTIHNVGDAATAIPLWIAFTLVRRKPTATFNYGLGRVEDLAGILIVAIILFSALVAGYEAIDRLMNPQPITQLVAVAVAGVVGFLGNEVVAVFRIKVGREMNSAALIADGYHARTDGLTSLAVVFGAIGVWLGFPLADPIIGLLITLTIFGIVWQSARSVITRSLDGIEPGITEEILHAGEHVSGIHEITEVKARWVGHKLHADVVISVDEAGTVARANEIAASLERELRSHLPQLGSSTIQFAKLDSADRLTQDRVSNHHHAPEPFVVNSRLAQGLLEIVDTSQGERMRLSLKGAYIEGMEALVEISRSGGSTESLPLIRIGSDDNVFESGVAPEEPHEFNARLRITVGGQIDELTFRMEEPAGHHH